MAEVDAVWDRLAFRTPWSRQRELARIRKARRPVRRSGTSTNPRAVPRRRARASRPWSTSTASAVALTGFADRLEIDDAGRVVVVDFKSARTRRPARPSPATSSSRLYQYAVDAGALDEPAGRPVASGGAELVQLGIDDDSSAAKVQAQPAHDDDGAERARAASRRWRAPPSLVRAETFPAVAGPALPRLPVRRHLPGQGRRERDRPVTAQTPTADARAVRLDTPQTCRR